MRNIYITFLFLIFCSMAYAQEQAKYRVTYDCDAQVVTGKTNTYRWTLDIGETTAIFYQKITPKKARNSRMMLLF